VQNALNKNCEFDLVRLLDEIKKKLKANNNDVKLMLIKWIETINSLSNVDISKCIPMFLVIFLELLNRELKHTVIDNVVSSLKNFKADYVESS